MSEHFPGFVLAFLGVLGFFVVLLVAAGLAADWLWKR